MIRPRTALTVTALAAATAVGGVAIAGAQDGPGGSPAPAAPSAGTPTRAASAPRTRTGDDGLTHAQATKARSAALGRVPGRAVQIERDADDGPVTYDVEVLTRGGRARELRLDRSFRVTRNVPTDADGLTWAAAGKASAAAVRRVRGVVTGVDVEDEGRARYEVEVLTPSAGERTVRLSSSFGVVAGAGDDAGDDD